MYKISEFSEIVNIPVRTLRYYAECGVLTPSRIDEFTGYKYYDDNNVLECELIKLLKSLDFTLEEIIQYKDCLNEEILENKKQEIEERMDLLKLKYKRLSLFQKELSSLSNYSSFNETEKEKILRRKYAKRNVNKCA